LGSEPHVDEFNCSVGNCVHWYNVAVPRQGKLRLIVEPFELANRAEKRGFFDKKQQAPGLPNFDIALSDGAGKSIARVTSEGGKERAIESSVKKGSYSVSVWSEAPGRPFAYRLTSKFKAAPKPRAKPRFEVRNAVILEAEGWGTDIEAVLIDLGSTKGMREGLTGRLIDAGEEIGTFEIEQVYPDGSRARIKDRLSRPLGPDTQVEIKVPIP
jgi:hypothetical protein